MSRRIWAVLMAGLWLSMGAGVAAAAVLKVPADYPTIQQAVDASVNGDTVEVAAGLYIEQVYITKNITLAGAGAALTTVRCPPVLSRYWGTPPNSYRPIIFIYNTPAATVTGLTVDGDNRIGPDTDHLLGIGLRNAGGRVEHCIVTNVRESTPSFLQRGAGIYSSKTFPSLVDIQIHDVQIKECQKSGIALWGALTAQITSVTVHGMGAGSLSVQNGIELGLGAVGVVDGCILRDLHDQHTTGNTATGVLLYFADNVQIMNSDLLDNQTSAYFVDAAGGLTDCTLQSNDAQIGLYGFAHRNSLPPKAGRPAPAAGDPPPAEALPVPYLEAGDDPPAPGGAAKEMITLTRCTISGPTLTDTRGVFVLAEYGTAGIDIDDCDISGWGHGFLLFELAGLIGGRMRDSRVEGNLDGDFSNTGTDYDARFNWWGHASGPRHATHNPGGTGESLTDHIRFYPWTGIPELSITPAASGPINCDGEAVLTFRYTPDGSAPPALRGYALTVAATPELSFDESDIADSGALSPLGDTYFDAYQNPDGSWTVAAAILGATPGLTAAADLFSITLHGAATGTGEVAITAFALRDLDNAPIAAYVTGSALITVDCDPPGPVADVTASPGFEKARVSWTLSPDDGAGDSDVAAYEVWRALWHDGTLGQSAYPEYDDVQPYNPAARPASRAAAAASGGVWELAGELPAGSPPPFVDAHAAPRGVYTYEVFARDAAGNHSPPAPDGNDRATNYWLGDVVDTAPMPPHYSVVDVHDITVLGNAFGTVHGGTNWNPECDVGPTDDYSRVGIPTTDNRIDFEDLMVFAMNFATVTQTNKLGAPDAPAPAAPAAGPPPRLAWLAAEGGAWALHLREPCSGLKGIRIQATLPAGAKAAVAAGELLGRQTAPVFLRDAGGEGLDIALAILGDGAGLDGSGELLRVLLPASVADRAALPAGATVTARGLDNTDLAGVGDLVDAPAVPAAASAPPAAVRLDGAHPNPFNPRAEIAFALPAAARVELTIYALDGRRVATLLEAELPAGEHRTVWNGRDAAGQPAAAGAYICRLKAGDQLRTRKLILAK